MRKGITPVVSIILLTLMTVGAAVLGFVWINTIQAGAQQRTGSSISESPGSSCSRLNIISMRGDGVTLSNVGCDTISNITVLVDGELTSYDLSSPIGPGQAAFIPFTESLEIGDHTITVVTSGGATASQSVLEGETTEEGGYVPSGGVNGTITTFSTGASIITLRFNSSSTKSDAKVVIPMTATVTSSSLNVTGYPYFYLQCNIGEYLGGGLVQNTAGFRASYQSWGAAVGDVDSWPGNEVLITDNNDNKLMYFFGNASNYKNVTVTDPRGVKVGEYNGSSSGVEIVVSSYSQNKVLIFNASGNQVGELSVTLPQGLDIGDYDSTDTGNELIVADAQGICEMWGAYQPCGAGGKDDKIIIFNSTGVNTYNISGFSCPTDVAIGEFNSSSPGVELIVADYGNHKVKIYSNSRVLINEFSLQNVTAVEVKNLDDSTSENELIAVAKEITDGWRGGGIFIFDKDINLLYTKPIYTYDFFGYDFFPTSIGIGEYNSSSYGYDLALTTPPDCNLDAQSFSLYTNSSSPWIDAGTDNIKEWTYSGGFGISQVTTNLTDSLNTLISSCSCTGCQISGSDCIIDLAVRSGSSGRIKLSDLSISYNIN